MAATRAPARCPDEGTCHHECDDSPDPICVRVLTCGPLSGVYPGDQWPADVDHRPFREEQQE